MKNYILISLVAILALLFVGCAPKKMVIKNTDQNQEIKNTIPLADTLKLAEKSSDLEMLKATNFTFSTLALRGKAKINLSGKENDVNITIRIKDQEKIWVSVSAIIGEVARVLITPDSIQIMNRLETTYTKKPFSFIHGFTNNKINFSVLQSILTGNTMNEFVNDASAVSANQNAYIVNGVLEELLYKFQYNTVKRLEQTELTDQKANQYLKVMYGNHQVYNGMMFPANINLNSEAGKNKIAVQIVFSTIEGNVPLEFPFTVGSRFKVVN